MSMLTPLRRTALTGAILASLSVSGMVRADDVPGTAPANSARPSVVTALNDQFFAATGFFTLSVDGSGSNSATQNVRVQKPNASATVNKAFLLAASTGFGNFTIPNGALTLNGTGVTWNSTVPSSISSRNHRADVTSIVKPIVDAAAAGTVNLTIGEAGNTGAIDGEALAVVFDDPTVTSARTIIMLFGAQLTTGDTFSITLAQPIDPAAPGALADMGLGISFSYQTNGTQQFSQINVNGQRLTTSAGGEDDGNLTSNGSLITVGGIGDTNANPANPNATPTNPRSDDELYSLLPLITAQTTAISVQTLNPSNDDNIFFAYFNLSGAAIVGGGIVLGPASATLNVGSQHTVTATVVDQAGAPRPGITVTFNVISGPNNGTTGQSVTNANGQASFSYTGNVAGIDQIRASYTEAQTTTQSNIATANWGGVSSTPTPTPIPVPIPTAGGPGLVLMMVALAAVALVILARRSI